MKTIKLKSKGLSGEEYINHLEKKGYNISSWAKDISKQVVKTKKGTEYEVVVMKQEEFGKDYITIQEVRDEAKKRGLITPPAEVAYLLRENLSNEDIEAMGLWWIITMHEPIIGSDSYSDLLGVNHGVGGRWVFACGGGPTRGWGREDGFGFLAP